MSTSNKKYQRKRTKTFPWIPIVLGSLLIVMALLSLASRKSEGVSANSASVVPMSVSFTAPELSLQNISGEIQSLAAYREQVVLVNNWATWCPPCKAEMPTLAAYYDQHAAEGFTIIAIEAGDAVEAVTSFVQNYGFKFPVWLDPNGAALEAFRNGHLPNSYVIDRAGIVRYTWTGEVSRTMLEKYVTPLLAGD